MNFLGVFGHVNLDYIFRLAKLPEHNTSIEVEERKLYYGGTAGNIARWAGKLGIKTCLASFVGTDFPKDFEDALLADDVDLTDLRKVEGQSTPTCMIFTDEEENQFAVIDQGPMRLMPNYELANHTLDTCQYIHIGTGRPEYYEKIMLAAKEKDRIIAFDPAQEIHYVYTAGTFARLLGMSDIFFANRNELATAMRYLGIDKTGDILAHVETMVLTLGKDGSQIFTRDGIIDIPVVSPEKYVDPTGAGDAYRAGFYKGLAFGMGMEDACRMGALAASFALESKGPQDNIPSLEAMLSRASKYDLKFKGGIE